MGVAEHLEIAGAKGGSSKPKTPVEAPDSLQSTNIASILLAVGEGSLTARRQTATSTSTTRRSWMLAAT